MATSSLYTQGQAISFIEQCFGPAKLTTGGLNANVVCPLCNPTDKTKKKLAIRTDNWWTKCWVCGFKSQTICSLLQKLGRQEQVALFLSSGFGDTSHLVREHTTTDAQVGSSHVSLMLPQGFELLAKWLPLVNHGSCPMAIKRAVDYLLRRGLTVRDLWYHKYGITTVDTAWSDRIIIPSHDSEGNLNMFTGRLFPTEPNGRYLWHQKRQPKYCHALVDRTSVVWNELNVDWGRRLTVVEGPMDLAKVNDNATCLLGKELSLDSKLFYDIVSNQTSVLLCLDSDVNQKTIKAIGDLLTSYGVCVEVMSLPPEIKDPGELESVAQFCELSKDPNLVKQYDSLYYLRNSIK